VFGPDLPGRPGWQIKDCPLRSAGGIGRRRSTKLLWPGPEVCGSWPRNSSIRGWVRIDRPGPGDRPASARCASNANRSLHTFWSVPGCGKAQVRRGDQILLVVLLVAQQDRCPSHSRNPATFPPTRLIQFPSLPSLGKPAAVSWQPGCWRSAAAQSRPPEGGLRRWRCPPSGWPLGRLKKTISLKPIERGSPS